MTVRGRSPWRVALGPLLDASLANAGRAARDPAEMRGTLQSTLTYPHGPSDTVTKCHRTWRALDKPCFREASHVARSMLPRRQEGLRWT